MGDIFIRYVNMDTSAIAFTATDENGDYNIYVNTAYGYDRQQKAIRHEMQHINMDHFYTPGDVLQYEKAAENPTAITQAVEHIHIEKSSPPSPLEKLRIDCGISLQKAAELRQISKQNYFLYEKGLAKCPRHTEHKIISSLLKYKDNKNEISNDMQYKKPVD